MLTRPGCHLCDEAIDEMQEYLARRAAAHPALEIEEFDIETDDQLHRRFLERIPVILIGDEVVSELAFDPDEFEVAIRRLQRDPGRGRVR